MKTIFILTSEQRGAPGHGEPGIPYLTLRTDGNWYTLGKPVSAFSTKEKAEAYKKTLPWPGAWEITELEVI